MKELVPLAQFFFFFCFFFANQLGGDIKEGNKEKEDGKKGFGPKKKLGRKRKGKGLSPWPDFDFFLLFFFEKKNGLHIFRALKPPKLCSSSTIVNPLGIMGKSNDP